MLLYLYLLVSCAAAGLAFGAGAAWYLVIAAFAGAFLVMLLVHLLFLVLASLFVDKEKPGEGAIGFYRKFITVTADLLLKLGGVKVRVEGAEKLPEGRCLIVQNHVSGFDPLALYPAFSWRRLFFVSKKENLAIPVGGRLMAGAGVMGLERENDRQGVLIMRRAAERMKNGGTVVIYPEGTRSKTGELGPFRNGCFKAAQWGEAPVAVVTVHGSAAAAKRIFRRRSEIVFRVLKVFNKEEIAQKRTDEIGAEVRACMLNDLNT